MTRSGHASRRRCAFARRLMFAAGALLIAAGSLTAAPGVARSSTRDHAADPAAGRTRAAVLAYHRFDPAAPDTMTVRPGTLRAQLRDLRERGWSVVPLRSLIEHLRGGSATLPPAPLAITVDDGHRTVFTELLPIVREERIPVTLFIYPSAISHAPYALTWEQLAELRASGFVDVQAHTYWHPRFDREKARLAPDAYHDFVAVQLRRSRAALEQHLGTPVDLLAWPFGLYDRELIDLARQHGYLAGFTLERRCVTDADDLMALPRHLVTEATWRATFRTMTKECRR
jgi:peptidoglycan/xylan/chitin deacetylase (PgdA/CDA1 family)